MDSRSVKTLLFSRFVDGGRGEKDGEGILGFDCWGAVMAAFRIFGVEVPDFHEHPDNPVGIGSIFDEQAESGLWERLDTPVAPCLVAMSTSLEHPNFRNHFGVYIGQGKFFHIQRTRGPHLDQLDAPPWPRCVKSFWRWRGIETPAKPVRPTMPEGRAMVVFMPNFMDPKQKVVEFVEPGRPVSAYAPTAKEARGVLDVSGELKLAASINAMPLEPAQEPITILKAGDYLLFKVVPRNGGGGGGKNPIAAIASLAIMVAAPHLTAFALTGNFAATAVASFGTGALVNGLISFGAPTLINAVLPPGRSSSGGLNARTGFEESATYSWQAETNPTRNGAPVPILYGEKTNITPHLLTRYVETSGDKQFLNMLFLVAEGELDNPGGIFDIKIDDNPRENYADVATEIRYGTYDQTPIQWFKDTIFERSVNVKLTTEWYQLDGIGTAIEGLGICFYWPRGLGRAGSGYEVLPLTMEIEVERRVDGGAWVAWDIFSVTGQQSTLMRRFWRIDDLTSGQHDIRVRLTEEPPSGNQYLTDCYFEYEHEIIPDDFSLPHSACFALRALATDQLSGPRPRVTCSAKRSTVKVWNDTAEAYDDKPANNLAWMAWDMAHHYRYGGGFPASRILTSEFASAAEWNDIKSITGTLYLDSVMDIQTAWDHMGRLGRFQVVQSGTKVGCVCDRPVDFPDQSMVVTEANVLLGTFGTEYLDTKDRADAIRVTYFDKVKGRSTFMVTSDFYGSITGRAPRIREETLYAGDDYQLCWAWAVFMLRCNRYLVETINRTMATSAIGALPGQVLQVGTVFGSQTARTAQDCTIGQVNLNANVTLEPGKSYKLWLMHVDRQSADTGQELVEIVDVTGVLEETVTDALFVSGALAYAPSPDCVIAFGEPTTTVKWYRIGSINRSGQSKLQRKIVALEYADEVYEDEGEAPPLETAATGAGVAGLQAGIYDRFEDGLAKKVVSLFWRGLALGWNVYWRRPDETPWKWYGFTADPSMDVYNLAVGYTYEFSVTDRNVPDDGEKATINFSGEGTGLLQAVTAEDAFGDQEAVMVTVDGVKFPVEVLL